MQTLPGPTSFHASMLQAWSAFADEFISVWDEKLSGPHYFNDAYMYFFGYTKRDDFISNYNFFGRRKYPLSDDIKPLLLDSLTKYGHWNEEVMFVKKDGEVFLGRLDIASFNYEGKKYFLKRIINIDTQRLFSENLFKEIKKFEALFQFATLPIVLVNKAGNIILANTQATTLFGYSADEMQHLQVEALIPMRFRDKHLSQRDQFEKQPENRPMGKGMQLSAIKKSGEEFPVEISLGHYMIDNEPYVIAFIIDITHRIEEETKTRELSQALSKERELSDLKSRFVSMASHEFRTPLSTILSSVSLISKYISSEDQDKRDKHILRIRSAVNNLTDILNEFLSLGRIEEGRIQVHLSEFNMREQVKLIVDEIKTILKDGQMIHYDHDGDAMVNLDSSLLRNILINLLSNAIKFSPEQSTILITTAVEADMIHIRIKDHGMGIPEDDKKHLFERFFRAQNVTNIQGTGLGLHIVSRYVELMNGIISVDSELERGTTFTLKFQK